MSKRTSRKKRNTSSQENVPRSIRNYSRLLDTKFRLGNFRFGIDPLIGLIPGIGDFAGAILSGGLISMAARHGASRKVIILMSLNALLDAVIGSIPVLGGIFDFFYKANTRNVRLLEKHFNEGKHQGTGKGIVAIIIITILIITGLLVYLILKLMNYLIGLL